MKLGGELFKALPRSLWPASRDVRTEYCWASANVVNVKGRAAGGGLDGPGRVLVPRSQSEHSAAGPGGVPEGGELWRTAGLLDRGMLADAKAAWCGRGEEMLGACRPGAAGQWLHWWALNSEDFPCGHRGVIRNKRHLHRWKCQCCERAYSEHGCEVPTARESHTNTAARSPGAVQAAGEARGGLSSPLPAVSRRGSPGFALPGWGAGVGARGAPGGLSVLLSCCQESGV